MKIAYNDSNINNDNLITNNNNNKMSFALMNHRRTLRSSSVTMLSEPFFNIAFGK